jgi:peptidoglycan hydrolase-like protein with peptidoglycan-binding domain/protocatechuate 3,4-dioxygenase beta subunit
MGKIKTRFFLVVGIVIFIFLVVAVPSVQAVELSSSEQYQLASLAVQLESLWTLVNALAHSFFYGASAQTSDACSASNAYACTTESECSSVGYFWCSGACYSTALECSGGSTTACNYDGVCGSGESSGSCPADCYTAAPTSSCSSSLIALLGDGCHWMYSGTDGRAIYCDGPMTVSAKEGDTATSSGCTSGSSTTACNYNGICDAGESSGSCPGDCYTAVTTGTCPSGYHYHSESGGFCINDVDNYSGTCYDSTGATVITCPASSSTYCPPPSYWDPAVSACKPGTNTSTCPSGYHYHPESGGFCINDQENYSGICYDSTGASTITCPSYTTPTSSSCTSQTVQVSCLAAGSQCRWYNLIDGSSYCDDEPHTPSQTSCDNSGTCDASETADFCPLDCGTADAVTLSSAAIVGDQLTVSYSKNFATCAHLLTSSSAITHTNNFYCTQGNNITITQPLSGFTSVSSDAQVKLCHGNNYNTCSSLVSVSKSAVACDYDAVCDAGESYSTCPNDCKLPKTPVISNVTVAEITTNSATISWTTDRPTTSKIEYWVTTVTGDFIEDPAFVVSHQMRLTALQPGTTYTYNVVSQDSNFYTAYAYSKTFKTLSLKEADTVAPTIVSFNSYVDSGDEKLHAVATFSESVDKTTLTNSNVFMRFVSSGKTFSGGEVLPFDSRVEYSNFIPPDPSTGFELVIKNIKDVVGNLIARDYLSPTFYWSAPTFPTSGSCPAGYHYHSESGGFCINEQDNYSGTCYDSTGASVITCPSVSSGYSCTYTTQSTCTADSACAWDSSNSFCYSSGTYPTTPGGGSCPAGYHYHSESGGFCINDQDNYSGTCYNSAGTATIACPTPSYGGACSVNTTEATCTTTAGCAWAATYCYESYAVGASCPSGWTWNTTANSCVKDGTACSDLTACSACSGSTTGNYGSWCSYDNDGCPTSCQTSTTVSGGGCYGFTTQSTCTVDSYGTSCYWYAGAGYGYCDMGPGSGYAGDEFSCPGFAYSRYGTNDSRYCQLNSARSCSVSYPGYLDPATYAPENCPKEQVLVTCPTGYYWFVPVDNTEAYCRATETSRDTKPPAVELSRSHPLQGDTSFPIDGKIKVFFNENIDQTSISSSTFKLFDNLGKAVPGSFEIFNDGFSFRSSQKFSGGTTYTWKILAGIRDLVGNKTTSEYSAKFTIASGSVSKKGALKGTVKDGAGTPVKGAFVQINDLNYSLWRGENTNASGTYAVLDLPAGSYRLSFYAPSEKPNLISPSEATITIEAGKTLTKDLSFLATTKTISGKVVASDGTAITDARISAWRRDGPGGAEAQVDSSGKFFLLVSGGSWEVNVWPNDYGKAAWTSSDERAVVQFANDSTVETKNVTITVLRQNSKIIGKIVNPDGTAPKPYEVSVSIDSFNRGGYPATLSSTGTFGVSVVAGSYEVRVWPSNQEFKVAPVSVTVADGATKDVGTIKLRKPTEKITGVVTDEAGKPAVGVEINAWQDRGGNSARGKTNENGIFSLSATPGIWKVSVESHSSSQYASIDPPKEVEVKLNGTASISLKVVTVNSFISGTVQDATGAVVKDFYGYVYVESFGYFGFAGLDSGGSSFGGSVDRGSFQLRVPSGTHTIVLDAPPGSDWDSTGSKSVTVAKGATAKTNFTLKKKGSEISGLVVDGSGVAVTGRSMRVFASGNNGVWQEGFVDSATGAYTLKVSAGTWFVNVDTGRNYGYGGITSSQATYQPGADVKVVVGDGEKKTQNLTLRKADATISGTVTKADGIPLSYVWVSIDSGSFSTLEKEIVSSSPVGYKQSFGAETDSQGKYSVTVPAGTYYVHAFIPFRERIINPEEQKVTVNAGDTVTADLIARTTSTVLSGIVFREGEASNGYVSGWSEKGGYVETLASSDGSYSATITSNDTWHFYAARNFGGEWYRSSEATITVVDETLIEQEFVMIRERSLAPPVAATVDADKSSVVKTDDGAKVVLPAQSTGTSGSVSVSVEPDPEVPQQGNAKVVGVGYDVRVHDDAGKEITDLNSAVTITIPYTDEDLVKQGITPQELKIAFWDENAGGWRELTASVVNEEDNTVTAVVDHLTRFAIVAAADITPPEPPAAVVITAPGAGNIDIMWTKPTKDFSHVKIYRSPVADQLGKVRFAEVFDNKVIDTGVTDGQTYYYTIRSVDPAGNESGNKEQVLVVAVGTSVASDNAVLLVGSKTEAPKAIRPTAPAVSTSVGVSGVSFSRSLTLGVSGADVTALQLILVAEGVYPEAITSGYFGALTKAAVSRFQDKYAAEVLAPAGLTVGTGYVGPSTIKKLNELSGGEVSVPAPATITSTTITPSGGVLIRDLTVGMSGGDVSTLQQLLVDEGVYPDAIVSGYFGSLTEAAVIRFQEKYAEEILAPVDLTSGSGYVGASTRAKVNALLGQ